MCVTVSNHVLGTVNEHLSGRAAAERAANGASFMSAQPSGPALSVDSLFAERDMRRRRDSEAEQQLQRRRQEELAEFRKRLDNFQLTDEIIQSCLDRVKRVFELGENELMITSFPSTFCTDDGRSIINAGAPP